VRSDERARRQHDARTAEQARMAQQLAARDAVREIFVDGEVAELAGIAASGVQSDGKRGGYLHRVVSGSFGWGRRWRRRASDERYGDDECRCSLTRVTACAARSRRFAVRSARVRRYAIAIVG